MPLVKVEMSLVCTLVHLVRELLMYTLDMSKIGTHWENR